MADGSGPTASELQKIGTVIARSLAFLCLQNTNLKDGSVQEKGQFLVGLGLSYAEAAEMLNTTAETVRVGIAKAKSAKGKGQKGGKQTEGKAKGRTTRRGTR